MPSLPSVDPAAWQALTSCLYITPRSFSLGVLLWTPGCPGVFTFWVVARQGTLGTVPAEHYFVIVYMPCTRLVGSFFFFFHVRLYHCIVEIVNNFWSPFLPPCGYQGTEPGSQVWQQVSLLIQLGRSARTAFSIFNISCLEVFSYFLRGHVV